MILKKGLFLALWISPAFSLAAPAVEVSTAAAVTAPVLLGDRTILSVRDRLHSLSALERAQRAGERIRRVARDPLARVDRIQPVEGEGATDISLGDLVLMSVTDKDAQTAGVSRRELAGAHAAAIREAVAEYKSIHGLRSWVVKGLFALLCTAGLLLGWRLLGLLRGKNLPRMHAWLRQRSPGVRLRHLELVSSGQVAELLTRVGGAASFIPHLLLVWVYSVLMFGIFPQTKGLSWWLICHVLGPLGRIATGAAGSIPDLLFVAVIVACTHYALRMARLVFVEIRDGRLAFSGFYPEWAMPTFQLVRLLAWAFALVVAFPYLPGSSSPAFKGVSVFLGVLFSLGSSSAVANVVAGIILTYMRPFKVGDRIRIGDKTGDVVEKSLLVTRLRTIKNVAVTLPNALVLANNIENYSACAKDAGLILSTTVTLGYDAPWREVHDLLTAAARETPGIKTDPSPFVLQTQLGDFSVSYELNAYTDDASSMARLYSRLHENIQTRFCDAGVEIMSPRFVALRDGNRAALPAADLPPGYRAPSFRVRVEGGPTGD